MNNVTLVGRITRDLDLKYSQSGVAVCNFNLAINRPFKSNDGQDADFINCVVFRKSAENLAQYMSKGSLIGIVGRIQTRNYDDKDGKKVYVTEVVADYVQFLESKGGNNQSNNQQNNYQGNNQQQNNYQNNNQQQNYSQQQNNQPNPLGNQGQPIDVTDQDLPF